MPDRTVLRSAAIVALLAAMGITAAASQETQIVRAEDALVALFTLQTEIEVEQRILLREEARYEANVQTRRLLRDRLAGLYEELEALFLRERAAEPGDEADDDTGATREDLIRQSEEKEEAIHALERVEEAARDTGRIIRQEIRRIQERIILLADKQSALRVVMPDDRDSVTGIWDVRILPSGDRGTFALWQSGTIVTGQYVLDGPFRGSLEGTLINRQLLIRRIDSNLGRTMELSGYLAEDGRAVQGTWLNYDLSSGKAPTGSWSATKRSSSPSEATGVPLEGL
jgi:hypothetical protein